MPYAFFLITSFITISHTSEPNKILLHHGFLPFYKFFVYSVHFFFILALNLLCCDEFVRLFMFDNRTTFKELIFISRNEGKLWEYGIDLTVWFVVREKKRIAQFFIDNAWSVSSHFIVIILKLLFYLLSFIETN